MEGWQRVYGGQVIGQALVAASRTVEEQNRIAHSLHGYFLRPGDTEIPILYSVDRIRDGKSFSTRRVVAVQRGEAIFSMAASFQNIEEGLSHQMEMPSDVPPPSECQSEIELRKKYIDKITNFTPSTDTLEIDTDSFSIDSSATFASGKNKKVVKKKLSKQNFDFLYDENIGWLYFNENGANKGFGEGGIIAILKGLLF